MHPPSTGKLEWIGIIAIAIGLALGAHPKVVASLAKQEVELSWLGHIGLFAFLVSIVLGAFALVVIVWTGFSWLTKQITRTPRDPQ